jgi:hypothetical protein
MRTAVVMLCVNNGAVLSFAWYLPTVSCERSFLFSPHYTYHRNAMMSDQSLLQSVVSWQGDKRVRREERSVHGVIVEEMFNE